MMRIAKHHRCATTRLIAANTLNTPYCPIVRAYSNTNQEKSNSNHNHGKPLNNLFGAVVLTLAAYITMSNNEARCENKSSQRTITRKEVEEHVTKEKGIWVVYKDGVYDITRFVANHPGGKEKILLAAGKDIEPFWNLYRQHLSSQLAVEQLQKMRIGTLPPHEVSTNNDNGSADENNPYKNDPVLSPLMRFSVKQPINAEPPAQLLTDSWLTPSDLWFVRNHHPVPLLDPAHADSHEVSIKFTSELLSGSSGSKDFSDSSTAATLTLRDLKEKFPAHTVATSIQCGGNRRGMMSDVKKTNGSNWDVAAISTGSFTGARLRDVLAGLGVTEDSLCSDPALSKVRHVHFVAMDGMEASIPVHKALARHGDVLLAYQMNGQPLPAKHGYPLRAVVPGHVGVRNVKWLKEIRLSSEEAQGPWQRGMAYKGFGPSVTSLEGIDVEKIPSLQEQPVQSAVTSPQPASKVSLQEPLTVKGYAYSGGGRGIVRVDVSVDDGRSWQTAELLDGSEQPLDRAWAWTFWEASFSVEALQQAQERGGVCVVCKATDASYNVQPDSVQGIWNLRGINNNAWHRVQPSVLSEQEESDDDDDDEDEELSQQN